MSSNPPVNDSNALIGAGDPIPMGTDTPAMGTDAPAMGADTPAMDVDTPPVDPESIPAVPEGAQVIGGTADIPEAVPEETDSDSSVIGSVAKDIAGGFAHDLHPAALVGSAVDGIAETLYAVGLIEEDTIQKWRNGRSFAQEASRKSMTGDPDETVTGAVVSEVAQIALPGTALFKGLKAAGLGSKAAFATAEVIASAMALNPDDPILANMIPEDADNETVLALRNFFATDPDDPEVFNRARRALEITGLSGVGFGAERLITLSRALRKDAEATGEALLEEGIEATAEADAQVASKTGDLDEDDLADAPDAPEEPTAPEDPEVTNPSAMEDVEFSQAKVEEYLNNREHPLMGMDDLPINVDKFDNPEQVQDAYDTLVAAANKNMVEAMTERETLASTHELATELGMNPRKLAQIISEDAEKAQMWAAHLVAARKVTADIGNAMATLIDEFQAGRMTGAEFMETATPYFQHLIKVKMIQRGHARAVSSGRIKATGMSDEEFEKKLLDSFIEHGDNPEAMAAGMKRVMNVNPGLLTKLFGKASRRKFWMVSNEVMINGLLSSTKTYAVNLTGNFLEMTFRPIELGVGGAIRRDPAAMHQAAGQFIGLQRSLRDSMRYAWTSLKNEEPLLDPGNRTIDMVGDDGDLRVIRVAPRFDAQGNPIPLTRTQTAINRFGNIIRAPSRGLMATDEFFKQQAYRSRVWGKAWAKLQNTPHTTQEKMRLADLEVERAFNETTGLPTDPEALNFARESTFTEDLLPGSLGKSVQNAVDAHPFLRSVTPFIRTPVNLFLHTYRRLPGIGMASRKNLDDWNAGGTRRAEVLGRQAVGTTMALAYWSLADSGQVTGNPPSDPTEANNLRQTGWKPLSYRYTDENGKEQFIELSRLDPRAGSYMGLITGMHEVWNHIGTEEQQDLLGSVVHVIMENTANRTYLQGLSETFDALASGDGDRIGKMLAQHTSNRLVPYSSAIRTGAQVMAGLNDEPMYVKEIRGFIDGLKNGIPGLGTLPAKRNMFGEKITTPAAVGFEALLPFQTSELDDRLVMDMLELGRAWQAPLPKWRYLPGVDLRDVPLESAGHSLYEEATDRMSTMKLNGKTVREAVAELVQSDYFKGFPDAFDPKNPDPGTKQAVVREMISAYRQTAWGSLGSSDSKVDKEIQELITESAEDRRDHYTQDYITNQ